MNKKKFLRYGLPALALTLLVGAGTASASGFGSFSKNNMTPEQIVARHNDMFQQQADLIGASLDEVKNAWANGTSFIDLAKSKGVTEDALKAKMKTLRETQMKTELQTLVEKGIITQAQADSRIATMQKFTDKINGKMKNGHSNMKGMGMLGGGFDRL